jgi:hypothetical protein
VTGSDPIAATYLRFNVDVDLNTAAGELGVTADDLRKNLNLIDPALGVLRQLSVDRDDFTDGYLESLCALQSISANAPDPNLCDQFDRR